MPAPIATFKCLCDRDAIQSVILFGSRVFVVDVDRERDAFLRGEGFRVMRFWNFEVD
ncbi:DUF559 domain-containing protein [Tardiphaga robiniae]|uniref:DUF559 domain-containing protein n=1 Tax=Tardiphaga robiniae TaxID=943830 RepID=UPI003D9B7F24